MLKPIKKIKKAADKLPRIKYKKLISVIEIMLILQVGYPHCIRAISGIR
ncbi:hypothetical protein HMPREF9554_01971 [Treponema phagedenis F0421]|nr:hypothetical protein HMPREF9554_01971 [Treponema phagedenis F0421]